MTQNNPETVPTKKNIYKEKELPATEGKKNIFKVATWSSTIKSGNYARMLIENIELMLEVVLQLTSNA